MPQTVHIVSFPRLLHASSMYRTLASNAPHVFDSVRTLIVWGYSLAVRSLNLLFSFSLLLLLSCVSVSYVTCRVLLLFLFAPQVGWESQYTYIYLEIIGFLILVTGTMVYNELIKIPGF